MPSTNREKAVDVHRVTAARIFGVPEEDVTPEQRRAARAANYNRLYNQEVNHG